MNKRGQFYFLAIIIIAVMVTSLIIVTNSVSPKRVLSFENEKNQINQEISFLLDHLVNKELSAKQSQEYFQDLTTNYIEVLGKDKDMVFIYQNETHAVFSGYKMEDSEIFLNTGQGQIEISENGPFTVTSKIVTNPSLITSLIRINTKEYPLIIQETRSINYIVNYKKDDELYIIKG